MPIKVVKINKDEVPSHIADMTRKGFRCTEIDPGEYSCTKKINEVQDYVVILLSSMEQPR